MKSITNPTQSLHYRCTCHPSGTTQTNVPRYVSHIRTTAHYNKPGRFTFAAHYMTPGRFAFVTVRINIKMYATPYRIIKTTQKIKNTR
jgi:hypothetical protein